MGKNLTKYFQDKVIKVDRDGPESRIGLFLDAGDDYIAVFTEDDGVVYYKTHHINSITENMKGELEFGVEIPEDFEYNVAENFEGLLESLKYCWVKINRSAPETVEGMLCEIENDFVFLVNKEEIVRISMLHIKNVSYEVKG
ncbi:hypothetical protein [Neobacillus niacini]|uniref:hypothetical protein n=1 Tax=Neobacillus niacini TaxID=86668 RepID=UPI0005F02221|nr:hypothetical protein [Neobacillus niacini]